MKVKIDNKIYDSNDHPIMIVLSDIEKQHLKNMAPTATKYCVFNSDFFNVSDVEKWMDEI